MKTNRGFTLIELLGTFSIIAILFLLVATIWVNISSKKQERRTMIAESNDATMSVKEKGILDGAYYTLLEDRDTKTKVFYYRGAMVTLPAKKEGL